MEWIMLLMFGVVMLGIVVLVWRLISMINSRVDCFEQTLTKLLEIQASDHAVLIELHRTQQRLADTNERLVETQGLQTSLLRAMDQQAIAQLNQAARDSYERLAVADRERREHNEIADALMAKAQADAQAQRKEASR